jgi:hypothetical protein
VLTGVYGEEMGDECRFGFPPNYGDLRVYHRYPLYAMQLEYANSRHGCANLP